MGDDAGEERGVLKLQLPPLGSCTAAPDAAAANKENKNNTITKIKKNKNENTFVINSVQRTTWTRCHCTQQG